MVGDSVLGESVTDKIKIKVASRPHADEAATGTVTVSKADAVLREAPAHRRAGRGQGAQGRRFKVTGKAGAFTRVELEPGRPAFVASGRRQARAARPAGDRKPAWQVTPPVLAVNAPTVVNGPSVTVKGVVTDDMQVKDLFIRVYNRDSKMPAKKVFYLPNRGREDAPALPDRRAAVAGQQHGPGLRAGDQRGADAWPRDRPAEAGAQPGPGRARAQERRRGQRRQAPSRRSPAVGRSRPAIR